MFPAAGFAPRLFFSTGVEVARRKRAHVPLINKLAAALACLLPAEHRNIMREAKAKPEAVLRLFEFDHIVLHCWGGSDGWWNLDPKLREAHREKSRADTSRAAKADRLDEARWKDFVGKLAKPKPVARKRQWPSRPFPSRRG